MTPLEPDDEVPYRHPLSRRIVAGVAIVALVLSAIGVGVAIARAQWGPPPDPVEQQQQVPA
ncbi:hypothetical protein [Cellulomonas sp. URHE0023]|uniref:hypothetical protein n=1 Tax=Cellulomonas sp. URHE0023 TaxID=1380354 RepID=UPI0004884277|nr:hypothetical protein [Cellulomonas sp. URHE0023]